MSDKMILSIIIPVYNVEKYLRKCLDSCLNQNISKKDYEIICINDGSPDKCDLILKEYSAKYTNIKIITQPNQGLSIARNNGLAIASGDYIWFVDSDDSISYNILDRIKDRLQTSPDLLQLNYQMTYEDNRQPIVQLYSIGNKKRVSGKYIMSNCCLPAPAQFTIYRRKFLIDNNLKFLPGILHEDSEFKPRATYLADSVEVFDTISYNYLQRQSGSITSVFKLKNGVDIIKVILSLHNFFTSNVFEESCRKGFCNQIGLHVNTLLNGVRSLNKSEKRQIYDLLKTKRLIFRDMMGSNIFKYKVEGWLFYISPKFAILLYNFLK